MKYRVHIWRSVLLFLVCLSLPGRASGLQRGGEGSTPVAAASGVYSFPEVKNWAEGTEDGSWDVGSVYTWNVWGSLPPYLPETMQYSITQTLDYRMDYAPSSSRLYFHNCEGQRLLLRQGKDYTFSEERLPTGEYRIVFRLTREGISGLLQNMGEGGSLPGLQLTYGAALNTGALPGVPVVGTTKLCFRNGEETQESVTEHPEIYTGGIRLKKVDLKGNPLEGAIYCLYREARLSDKLEKRTAMEIDGRVLQLVPVAFCAGQEGAELVTQVTTDKDGIACFWGMAYGTYYIQELSAPAGYDPQPQLLEARIGPGSHLTARQSDATILVSTTKPDEAPASLNVTLLSAAITAVVSSAFLLLLLNAKRRG